MRMRLGLSGGPVPRVPGAVTPTLARELAGLGIRAVALHLEPPPETIAGRAGERVRDVLAGAGIDVVQTTGYNPRLAHPDDTVRRRELRRLERAFDAAASLGAEMVLTGCGSLNPDHYYGPHPANHHHETRERLIDSLDAVAPVAEKHGILLALECHVATTLDTPRHIRQVLEAVDSPAVRANFDPVNLLGDLPSVYGPGPAMRRMWKELRRWYAPSAHLKDICPRPGLVLHIDEAPPGDGLLDFDAYFAVCRRLGDGAALIVEHLPTDQAVAALNFVKVAADKAGISLA